MSLDLPENVLLRLGVLEQQVATLASIVGHDRSESNAERETVLARLRALEEAVAADRLGKDRL